MKQPIPIRDLRLVLLTAAVCLAAVMARAQDDPVFRAMHDEMDRSVQKLSIKDVAPPYFLSYRVRDYDVLNVKARYGGMVQSDRSRDRYLYIDLRVGGDSLDNSNFFSGWQDLYSNRLDLVTDNNYDALRHQLWLETDRAYKDAAENLARKKAWMLANPSKEEIPDLSSTEPFVYTGQSVTMDADQSTVEALVRKAAEVFGEFKNLEDWRVEYTGQAVNQRYLNSQGGKHLKGNTYYLLEITATAQSPDGERLTNFLQYPVAHPGEMPSAKDLQADVRRMAGDLQSMAAAPSLDEYAGPVLFTDWAAAQFVSQMFVDNLTLTRDPLLADEWMRRYIPTGKLAGKVKHRVLPEFVSVTDEPSRQVWQGRSLTGCQVVDDEDVKCQDITLVDKGRLVNLPMTRQPTKKLAASNGHARSTVFQKVLPGITNLMVSSSQPKDKMIEELRRLCKEQDLEYGLMISRLDEPRFSSTYNWSDRETDEPPMLSAPVVVYKVYAANGRVEPVRGLIFDDLSIMSLRNIAAMGKDSRAYNITQGTILQGSMYPASIVTPSILVDEMELKAGNSYEPLPVAGNPFFGK